MILRRLIELTAFTGCVVVLYADYGRALLGNTAAKLALMFPGLDPARMADGFAAYGTCRNIRFLPYECRSALTEAVAFGFTGGADDMSTNYALQLNVRFFARIQPYLWDDPPSKKADSYYESSRVEQPDGRHLYMVDAFPAFQDLPIKPPRTETYVLDSVIWDWYADGQTFDEDLARRTRNARAILAACGRTRAEDVDSPLLWTMYGLQHFTATAPEMFLVCVLAALRCQRDAPRSIVICSCSPHAELTGWASLIDALADDLGVGSTDLPALRTTLAARHTREFGEGVLSTAKLDPLIRTLGAWIHDRSDTACIRVHRGYDANTKQWMDISGDLDSTLREMVSPTVHFVELGSVPMDVFHHCVTNSDLPSVIEGQAAANLMTSQGRPFLQILRPEHVIKNGYALCGQQHTGSRMPAMAAQVAATIRDQLPERCLASVSAQSPVDFCAELDRIAAFVLEASCTSTGVARYFSMLGHHFARNGQDKLLVALLAVREVMLAG
ncbi:MAG: hypothetical protein Q7J47_12055 [Azoarcus sp.]|nr:hypothetical protein [Azoarcus sp.]